MISMRICPYGQAIITLRFLKWKWLSYPREQGLFIFLLLFNALLYCEGTKPKTGNSGEGLALGAETKPN